MVLVLAMVMTMAIVIEGVVMEKEKQLTNPPESLLHLQVVIRFLAVLVVDTTANRLRTAVFAFHTV